MEEIYVVIISGVVAIISSVITAYITTNIKIKQEEQKWFKEFAFKYAELKIENPQKAEKIANQFGIGVLVLKNYDKEGTNKYFVAPNSRLIIGRDKNCDIVINDPTLSRQHLAIKTEDKETTVEYLSSTNPILINNLILKESQKLNDNDEITIGSSKIIYVKLD